MLDNKRKMEEMQFRPEKVKEFQGDFQAGMMGKMDLESEEIRKFQEKLQAGINCMCIWPWIRIVVAFAGNAEVVYGRFIWYFRNDGILVIWCNGGVCFINKDFIVSVKFPC